MSNPTRLLSQDNKFGRISGRKPVDFKPKKVIHVFLTMDLSKPGDLQLNVLQPQGSPFEYKSDKELEDYALGAYDHGKSSPVQFLPNTQYDIVVKEQCWIILQLDPSIKNWQFALDDFGCTTKSAANDRNCYLRHVYRGQLGKPGDPVDRNGCQVLYFGVYRRGARDSNDANDLPSELFNFHTEFLQAALGARLPVIFDPDIKNDADNNFP